MKFSSKEDIEAPIDAVFEMLCDFEMFERSALRRGAEVQRGDTLTAPGLGMIWNAAFDLRGKRRTVKVEIVTFDRPNEIVLESSSTGLDGVMELELVSLSRSRTRINVSFELKPLTLTSRLLVQSMKLAKTRLTAKFKARVTEYAKIMEDRYARST